MPTPPTPPVAADKSSLLNGIWQNPLSAELVRALLTASFVIIGLRLLGWVGPAERGRPGGVPAAVPQAAPPPVAYAPPPLAPSGAAPQLAAADDSTTDEADSSAGDDATDPYEVSDFITPPTDREMEGHIRPAQAQVKTAADREAELEERLAQLKSVMMPTEEVSEDASGRKTRTTKRPTGSLRDSADLAAAEAELAAAKAQEAADAAAEPSAAADASAAQPMVGTASGDATVATPTEAGMAVDPTAAGTPPAEASSIPAEASDAGVGVPADTAPAQPAPAADGFH